MDKLLLLAGPTASGKTDLAVSLAQKFSGEIISADSRQVYQGMDIGTGKDIPEKSEIRIKNLELGITDPKMSVGYRLKEEIPIWLTGIVKPDYSFHVSLYRKLALKVISDIHKRHKLPIVVGGTGLYLKSLLTKMPDIEVKPDPILRNRLEGKTTGELAEILRSRDLHKWQTMNRSDRQNPRRLIRAIELAGKKSSNYLKLPDFDFLLVYLNAPLPFLKKKIYQRINQRLKEGVLSEIENLLRSGYSFSLPSFSASPYRQLKDYFEKGKTEELFSGAIADWQKAEVNYVKRQIFWFKKMTRELAIKGRILQVDASGDFQEKLDRQIKEWYTSH